MIVEQLICTLIVHVANDLLTLVHRCVKTDSTVRTVDTRLFLPAHQEPGYKAKFNPTTKDSSCQIAALLLSQHLKMEGRGFVVKLH